MTGDRRPNSQEDAFGLPPDTRLRFFFDAQDGDRTIVDENGLELDSMEAAQREAVRALRDLVRDIPPDSDHRTMAIRVRNEVGETVLVANLTLSVQRVR